MELENLGRKELQALAKQYGIKANLSTAAIVEQLGKVFAKDIGEQCDECLSEKDKHVEKVVEERKSILDKQRSEISEELLNDQPLQIELPQLTDEVGPFSVSSHERSSSKVFIEGPIAEEVQQGCAPLEDAQIGDTVEVFHDGKWQLATVRRVNKITYRVRLQTSNQETTIKMSDARNPIIAAPEIEVVDDNCGANEPQHLLAHSFAQTTRITTTVQPGESNELTKELINTQSSTDVHSDDEGDDIFVDACEVADTVETEDNLFEVPEDEMEQQDEDDVFLDTIEGDEDMLVEEEPEGSDEIHDNSFEVNGPESPSCSGEESAEQGDISMTMDMVDDDDLLFTTVCVPTPSVVKRPLERKSFAAVDNKTPKKARVTELLPWNSSAKRQSNTRFSFGPSSQKKAPQSSARKSFSTTPAIAAPVIVPKTNAAQRLRMEAMKKKTENNSTAQKSLGMKVTPLTNKVTSLTQKAAPSSTSNAVKLLEKTKIAIDKTKSKSKVQFDSAQSSTTMAEQHELTGIKQSAASIASNKKVGPNFNKMHQKQFNNSKPITSLVERNQDIAKKMDEAFEAATNGVPKETMKAKISIVNKPGSLSKPLIKAKNLETKKTSFLTESTNSNKENGSFINSFLSSTGKIATISTRITAKEAAINQGVSRKEARKEAFIHDSKKKREDLMSMKRRSVVEPTQHNPFHYVA